jgi:hypothetical protein
LQAILKLFAQQEVVPETDEEMIASMVAFFGVGPVGTHFSRIIR